MKQVQIKLGELFDDKVAVHLKDTVDNEDVYYSELYYKIKTELVSFCKHDYSYMDGLYIFHGKTKKELIEVLYGFQKTFIPEKWRIFPIDCTDIDIYRDDIPNNDFEFINF